MNNPYTWNEVNPALFYGQDRIALLVEMLNGLTGSPRASFGVTGSRRMGKTTLLRRLEQDLLASKTDWEMGGMLVVPIYIDGLTLPRPLHADHIWHDILYQIKYSDHFSVSDIPHDLDFSTFKQFIQPLLTDLPLRPRIIVLFDEIEPIMVQSWSGGFFAQWRALLSNSPGLSEFFTAVFSGAREMAELQRDVGSPLKDILEWRMLRVLDFEDTCLLLREPSGIEWTEAFCQQVHSETGGHPMLLQYVMQKTCTQHTEADLAASALSGITQRFVKERGWHFEEWWHRYCSPDARRVYVTMPDDGSDLPLRAITKQFGSSQARAALEILQHVGIVTSDDDGFLFRYVGAMFRRWFSEHAALEEDILLHDQDIYTRLTAYGLHDKYLAAWHIYQADLPNYSGAVSEIRDTFTLLLHQLAPDDQVESEPGFKFETGEKRPTRKQRVRYVVRQRYANMKNIAKEVENDVAILEILLAHIVVKTYEKSSSLTHTTSLREDAFEMLKRWDVILKRLLP
ncbi:MAG: hypothetical protein EI684_00525 [Candidatus Viridilinea halotolerans]|uniref:Predicted pPIWI-associating nuclease domain-containing protein n=1 Tax=Candidatus Viridilinea halotolerans TaxID=2491704 RepID=A0A426UBW6_9CHLR|nr:MAG: hypothetical protein EI684_00525 [Candidatus Viridilinea halotolerans]